MPNKLEKGYKFLMKGDREAAQKIFNEIVKKPPETPQDYAMQGEAYFRLANKHSIAIKYLKKAASMEPNDPEPQEILGEIYFAQGRYNLAREYFQKAHELRPSSHIILNNLAATAMDQRDYDAAIKYAKQAIKKAPEELMLRMLLSEIYKEARMYKESVKAYEDAINIAQINRSIGGEITALYGLADLYENFHNYDKAIETYKKALEKVPNEPIVKHALERVQHKKTGIRYIL